MKLLEERIRKDGIIGEGDVLKIGSFLNQQIDVGLVSEMGREFHRLFGDAGVTKILTVEASGIAIACLTAPYFGVPVVFAKKSKTSNIAGNVLCAECFSYTHNCVNNLIVPAEFLSADDKVLIIDDFLANGSAVRALCDLAHQAGAEVVGAGIAVEKAYQAGGKELRGQGLRIESLARIASMSVGKGITFCR